MQYRFLLQRPQGMPLAVWIVLWVTGLCILVAAVAITLFLGLVVLATGLAVATVGGLVTVFRGLWQNRNPDKVDWDPNRPEDMQVLDVEDVCTIPLEDGDSGDGNQAK